jgi:hypothetical protein
MLLDANEYAIKEDSFGMLKQMQLPVVHFEQSFKLDSIFSRIQPKKLPPSKQFESFEYKWVKKEKPRSDPQVAYVRNPARLRIMPVRPWVTVGTDTVVETTTIQ